MYNIRAKFMKTGLLKYISHLDTMRLFRRCFQKAHIPMSMSQGFNPHPKFSMAQALGIGVESYGEYLDLTLDEKIAPEAFKSSLNDILPSGIRVIEAAYLDEKEKPAMSLVCASDYRVSAIYEGEAEDFVAQLEAYFQQDQILILQRRKRKGRWEVKQKDLRKGLLSYEFCGPIQGGYAFSLRLSTGSKENTRIDDFIENFAEFLKVENQSLAAIRTEMLKEEKEGLVPLLWPYADGGGSSS